MHRARHFSKLHAPSAKRGVKQPFAFNHWSLNGGDCPADPPISCAFCLADLSAIQKALFEKSVGAHARQQRNVSLKIDRHFEYFDIGRTAGTAQREFR
jgi:hypothetical protein